MQSCEATEEGIDARITRVDGIVALFLKGPGLAEPLHVLDDHAFVGVVEHEQDAVGFCSALRICGL